MILFISGFELQELNRSSHDNQTQETIKVNPCETVKNPLFARLLSPSDNDKTMWPDHWVSGNIELRLWACVPEAL